MKATVYIRPHGRAQDIDVFDVYPADEQFFQDNAFEVSMEDTPLGFIVYADVGIRQEDGTPVEAMELAGGRDCKDTLNSLRRKCVELMAAEDI
ncbi:hypothetical protein KAJ83_01695 [Marivibrio halodurans]|uniref:Uncharacterized protein n=1 Tax=Marivibrio halodurans TaxID=2039722 RepID=A0A8J7UZI0_9PROT|nr:hypothetical protein [Marivibrio halodurans]MBP5855706.1 hypothetical protein [Marivibrio halodurans]